MNIQTYVLGCGGGVGVFTEGCGVEMIVPASDTSDSFTEGSGVDTLAMGDWERGGVGTGVGTGV